jgi:hypothetical protein
MRDGRTRSSSSSSCGKYLLAQGDSRGAAGFFAKEKEIAEAMLLPLRENWEFDSFAPADEQISEKSRHNVCVRSFPW